MRFPSPLPPGRSHPADESPAPQGLPEPRPYGHLGPGDGACLMETASVLAAEPFTDSPRTTDAALAALARTVNDAVGDRARHRLLPLAADLAAAPAPSRAYQASLIAEVLGAARTVRPASRTLALREARCRRRALRLTGPSRGRLAGLGDALWWRGPGRHHLEHALRVLVRAPDADDRLVRLLRDAVAAAKQGSPRSAPARTDTASASVG